MAETKVKEVTLREQVIERVATALMGEFELGAIDFTKEGLVLNVEDNDFVIKTIQKKAAINSEDIKGTFTAEALEGEFVDEVDADVTDADLDAIVDEWELEEADEDEEVEVAV